MLRKKFSFLIITLFSLQDEANIPNSSITQSSDDDDTADIDPLNHRKNKSLEDLEHVIELYDFPSTFKSHDIMQLYHEFQKEATMYIKWCDDTHALLVFSSPTLGNYQTQQLHLYFTLVLYYILLQHKER